jgi:hypothetical protein
MAQNYIEIPAAWCRDKNVISGYISVEAARKIVESALPEDALITIKAFYSKDNIGETRTPVAAIRAKFKEKLMILYESKTSIHIPS